MTGAVFVHVETVVLDPGTLFGIVNLQLSVLDCRRSGEVFLRFSRSDGEGSLERIDLYLVNAICLRCDINGSSRFGNVLSASISGELNPRTRRFDPSLELSLQSGTCAFSYEAGCYFVFRQKSIAPK